MKIIKKIKLFLMIDIQKAMVDTYLIHLILEQIIRLIIKKLCFQVKKVIFFQKLAEGKKHIYYYGTKLSYFNGSEVNKKIINAKIIDPDYDVPHYINNENRFIVQSFQSPGFPYLKAVQEFALT